MHTSKFLLPRIALGILGIVGVAGLTMVRLQSSAEAAAVEAITGLPSDITPLLSIAGTWQPVADKYIDQTKPSLNTGVTLIQSGNIVLPNGREGVVFNAESFSGFTNPATSITPVNLAMLEQQPDGTLQLATSKYLSDPQTNGGSNVLVTDFNHDGVDDLYLPAANESPPLPASSTAFLSDGKGTYSKVNIGDHEAAHGATVANINGNPTVFTASYIVTPPPNGHADTETQYGSGVFTTIGDIGTGGNSSVAVADFYGDGIYSMVCGDCKYGPNFPFEYDVPPTYFGDCALESLRACSCRAGLFRWQTLLQREASICKLPFGI